MKTLIRKWEEGCEQFSGKRSWFFCGCAPQCLCPIMSGSWGSLSFAFNSKGLHLGPFTLGPRWGHLTKTMVLSLRCVGQ